MFEWMRTLTVLQNIVISFAIGGVVSMAVILMVAWFWREEPRTPKEPTIKSEDDLKAKRELTAFIAMTKAKTDRSNRKVMK